MATRTTLTQIPPPPVPEALPVLPLRGGTVVYPMAVLPMRIGQPRSVKLVGRRHEGRAHGRPGGRSVPRPISTTRRPQTSSKWARQG